MPAPHLADATHLEQWADRMAGRYNLPELIRRLILVTSSPTQIEFRAQEGTSYSGWDGYVQTGAATAYVPGGISGWEMGAGDPPQTKANSDYENRTNNPTPFGPSQTTFVFCTPRRWAGKNEWLDQRRKEGKWRDVRVYDADDIATWLATAPGVHVWFSLELGIPIDNVDVLSEWYKAWSSITSPTLSPDILLSGRAQARDQLIERLSNSPNKTVIRAESADEALAVVAAAIEMQARDSTDMLNGRALIVEQPGEWRFYASQQHPLILIPRFQNDIFARQATERGHHVIVPVGIEHHLPVDIDVPRLGAVEASELLEQQGLPAEKARHLAAQARRSLTAYRRICAERPLEVPTWAQDEEGPVFLPLILAGGWDESSEGDRTVVERLTERQYRDVRTILMHWRNKADSPFRLIGSQWGVNAKEDAWRLLVHYATAEDIRIFVGIADEVLQEKNPKHGFTLEEQLAADLEGIRPIFSPTLKQGIADSLAMLGALGSSEVQMRTADGGDTSYFAAAAVRNLLERAEKTPDTWLGLAPYLSELAEAAPEEFLNIVDRDLATEKPTLLALFEPQPGFLSPNYAYPQLL